MNTHRAGLLALALAIALPGCSGSSAPQQWDGTVAMEQEFAHYQPQGYHLDAMIRAHDALTQGVALVPKQLDKSTVKAVRDDFLSSLGKGRWLHGDDLAALTDDSRLELWKQALEGTDLSIVQQTGALVRQRQKVWQATHGSDAAGPSVGLPLPHAEHWQQAFGSWTPDQGASPLKLLDMDQTIQLLLASWAQQFDAHTALVPPEVSQTYVESAIAMAEGVGLGLSLRNGSLAVTELLVDGPAQRSGEVKVGDVLLSARKANDSWTPLREVLPALAFFRQPTDWFELRLRRGKQTVTVRLTPSSYANLADKLRVSLETLDTSQGPIRALRLEVRFFYEKKDQSSSLVEDVNLALSQARTSTTPPDLVILDMRQARGGAVPEAVAFASLFAPKASMGTIRTGGGSSQVLNTAIQPAAWEGPVQVWVGPLTASSAELAAQAIGDSAPRSEVMGWPTYGKGTLQRRVEMDMESARQQKNSRLGELWVTVGELYGPTGRSLQLQGVSLDWTLANPLDRPWGERAAERALPTGKPLTGAKAAPEAKRVGSDVLHPALSDAQALPALRQAAAQVWDQTVGASGR